MISIDFFQNNIFFFSQSTSHSGNGSYYKSVRPQHVFESMVNVFPLELILILNAE